MNVVIIIIAAVCIIAVCALAVRMIVLKKSGIGTRIFCGIGAVFITALMGMLIFMNIHYYPTDTAKRALESDAAVTVTHKGNGYLFDGSGIDSLLIFYPGARVKAEAYAPLMRELAESGVDCFIVEMPMCIAFMGIDRADDVIEEYGCEHVYIGGHSLGGACASMYANKNPDKLDGIVFLASFPMEHMDDSLEALRIYGTNDEVLNMDSYEGSAELLPDESTEVAIEGGNHAQFGSYGHQRGDGEADISPEEQWQVTVDAICEMIKE